MTESKWKPPLVIDMHEHLNIPGTVEWARLKGISRTVLLAGPSNNEEVIEFCGRSDGEFIPYCFLDISDTGEACRQLRRYREMGFVGVKFQPLTQGFLPHEKRMYPLWETIEELGMPLTSHSGCVNFPHHCLAYADPSGWSNVAWDFPELKIVIAHMGGNFNYQALVIAESRPNVWLDTAYLHWFCARMLPPVTPQELLTRAVRFAGAESVVYAGEGMSPRFVEDTLDVSLDARKRIFWKNALEIIGEPEV